MSRYIGISEEYYGSQGVEELILMVEKLIWAIATSIGCGKILLALVCLSAIDQFPMLFDL
jgi:hypothetical protein